MAALLRKNKGKFMYLWRSLILGSIELKFTLCDIFYRRLDESKSPHPSLLCSNLKDNHNIFNTNTVGSLSVNIDSYLEQFIWNPERLPKWSKHEIISILDNRH